MAKANVKGVAGVNSQSALHPRKLFVSGLPKISTDAEIEERITELETAFRKYGGPQGGTPEVIAPVNSTFAFVELESSSQADLAMTEMQTSYRMNRARRSRHEVLQEERRNKLGGGGGGRKESHDWD
eukprot:CAMPEP_0172517528 /NCGR_PEP_ID=MMETSP1066-20121228/285830_1 /TAXON_ID=671091 /ORGANISM="Coscinodiscus wailesii, Strain CCMP2513" /LENGTH=126 /DNA_ID=CAMNT_0013299575 /DNA_START=128 /DNA_END=508 /DNA_ORIENTATION=+